MYFFELEYKDNGWMDACVFFAETWSPVGWPWSVYDRRKHWNPNPTLAKITSRPCLHRHNGTYAAQETAQVHRETRETVAQEKDGAVHHLLLCPKHTSTRTLQRGTKTSLLCLLFDYGWSKTRRALPANLNLNLIQVGVNQLFWNVLQIIHVFFTRGFSR
jgi:hypothetical protein